MHNHPSKTVPSVQSYHTVRQYFPQSYYYSFEKYPSSSTLTPVIYTSQPRDRYTSLLKYYDDEEGYFSEHHHHRRYSHHINHLQYPNNQKSNRARTTSSQSQQKVSSVLNENSAYTLIDQQGKTEYEAKNSMSEIENGEHGVLKRDTKRTTNNLYKSLTTEEFLAKTPAEIRQEFRRLPNPPAKDTHAAKEERNVDKSRYRDVLPSEATRVKLQPDSDEKHDFINANYVSGYNDQEKAYIFTQGPLQTTVKDFWRMVWQENIAIIVMTTNIRETGTLKCFPYWPTETNAVLNAGLYQIQNEKYQKFESFAITTLTLRKKNHHENRTIYHAHYLKWPDHGIPSNTKDALLFLNYVENYRQLTMTKSPILLHCSAGIGRTGTFCAIDIGIKRYLEKEIVDIPSTVVKMRTERAGSIQTEDQYLFVYLAMTDYINQYQALQERINQPIKSFEKDSMNIFDGTKVKVTNDLNEIDDHIHKTSRLKSNTKKSNDLEQIHNISEINSNRSINVQDSTSRQGKILNDLSVSSVQYVTPSSTILQTRPTHQRTSTEYTLSMPYTTSNIHNKKARK